MDQECRETWFGRTGSSASEYAWARPLRRTEVDATYAAVSIIRVLRDAMNTQEKRFSHYVPGRLTPGVSLPLMNDTRTYHMRRDQLYQPTPPIPPIPLFSKSYHIGPPPPICS